MNQKRYFTNRNFLFTHPMTFKKIKLYLWFSKWNVVRNVSCNTCSKNVNACRHFQWNTDSVLSSEFCLQTLRFFRYIEVYGHSRAQTIVWSNRVQSNYVYKKMKMRDLHFTPVNSLSAEDTKDGSTCESVQLLEIHITALHWILL